MKDVDHIEVRISKEEIRTQLKKMLGSEHSELISQIIIDNLAVTDVGLSQLYKSFSGLKDEFKYRAGMKVWVNKNALYSWKINDTHTEANGLMKHGKVICTIMSVTKTSNKPYKMKYKYADDTGNVSEETTSVEESYVYPYDEYPLDQ